MNNDPTLAQAAAAIKLGDKVTARGLLGAYLKTNPQSAQGWYMAAFAVSDKAQQIDALKRALAIAPDHESARKMLDKLQPSDALDELLAAAPIAPLRVLNTPRKYPPWAGGLAIVAAIAVIVAIAVGVLLQQTAAARQVSQALVDYTITLTAYTTQEQQQTKVAALWTATHAPTLTATAKVFPTQILPPSWTPAQSVPTDIPVVAATPNAGGKWIAQTSTSALTDATNMNLALYPEGYSATDFEPPYLIVRCKAKVLDVYVNTFRIFSSSGDPSIKYRFDNGNLFTDKAALSTDETAFFFTNSIAILSSLEGASRFAVGYSPVGSSKELTFDVRGLAQADHDLRKQCGI